MTRFAPLFGLAIALSTPALATAQESEGRRVADPAFSSLDTADRGLVDQGEFSNFGCDVFVAMDGDEVSRGAYELSLSTAATPALLAMIGFNDASAKQRSRPEEES